MISPSENEEGNPPGRGSVAGMPVRLMEEERRRVSRLEFHPLERPAIPTEPELELEREQEDASEDLLKKEVATLGGRLRSQAEQLSVEVELARSEARIDARRDWEKELKEKIAEERSSLVKVCEEFRRERARYFAGVEAEVVKLALAIAARVLHREATLDPLLLAGVVKVALGKVAEDSSTVLRVPADEVERWQELFAERPDSSLRVVGDERLGAGECVLDTNVGKVELGVSAQLEEIERGFFDLMQQRPA
jgi:flagellar assembly protein FliH